MLGLMSYVGDLCVACNVTRNLCYVCYVLGRVLCLSLVSYKKTYLMSYVENLSHVLCRKLILCLMFYEEDLNVLRVTCYVLRVTCYVFCLMSNVEDLCYVLRNMQHVTRVTYVELSNTNVS